jgi:predicted amidohydrolase YtcJ
LAKNETWQIPTLTLSTSFANRPFESNVWQDGFKYLPESIENQWKMDIEEIKSSEVSEFDKEYAQWMMDMTGRIHDTGIEIMAGTDCPIFFLTPGQSLHKELEKLVETGLSPLEAIKAATLNPAKYFNLENELGSIKANMWADLVILDANPLENISNTTKINAVIKQGNLISRSQLDQILAKLSSN